MKITATYLKGRYSALGILDTAIECLWKGNSAGEDWKIKIRSARKAVEQLAWAAERVASYPGPRSERMHILNEAVYLFYYTKIGETPGVLKILQDMENKVPPKARFNALWRIKLRNAYDEIHAMVTVSDRLIQIGRRKKILAECERVVSRIKRGLHD